jgi:hypothetical protein
VQIFERSGSLEGQVGARAESGWRAVVVIVTTTTDIGLQGSQDSRCAQQVVDTRRERGCARLTACNDKVRCVRCDLRGRRYRRARGVGKWCEDAC